MNTISTSGQRMATEGRYYNANALKPVKKAEGGGEAVLSQHQFPKSAAEVAEKLVQNLADTKANIEEFQKIADIVMGHSVRFSVNQELGSVVIRVIDPKTNKTIREIPSEDMQRLKAHLKHSIGLIFDELI